MGFANWDELRTTVEQKGNILTVNMDDLKNLQNVKKLGKNVCKDISESLKREGIFHVPEELPTHKDDKVRLYRKDTKIGKLIESVIVPGKKNDEYLATLFPEESQECNDYKKIVTQIKELVN